jgi:hypothetical protein
MERHRVSWKHHQTYSARDALDPSALLDEVVDDDGGCVCLIPEGHPQAEVTRGMILHAPDMAALLGLAATRLQGQGSEDALADDIRFLLEQSVGVCAGAPPNYGPLH